jgi:hypothetical protein
VVELNFKSSETTYSLSNSTQGLSVTQIVSEKSLSVYRTEELNFLFRALAVNLEWPSI